MRKVAQVLVLAFVFGCASLNPFAAEGPDPLQMFGAAKAAYVTAYSNAVQYVAFCQARPPTKDCDQFTVKVSEIDGKARQNIVLGEMVVRGITTPEMNCDEAVDPGCTERLRLAQIQRLATVLQQLALELGSVRR